MYRLKVVGSRPGESLIHHLDYSEALLEAKDYTNQNDEYVLVLNEDYNLEPQAIVYHGIVYN